MCASLRARHRARLSSHLRRRSERALSHATSQTVATPSSSRACGAACSRRTLTDQPTHVDGGGFISATLARSRMRGRRASSPISARAGEASRAPVGSNLRPPGGRLSPGAGHGAILAAARSRGVEALQREQAGCSSGGSSTKPRISHASSSGGRAHLRAADRGAAGARVPRRRAGGSTSRAPPSPARRRLPRATFARLRRRPMLIVLPAQQIGPADEWHSSRLTAPRRCRPDGPRGNRGRGRHSRVRSSTAAGNDVVVRWPVLARPPR